MKNYKSMNFSEIVGLLNEPNRPSGGTKTIQEVILNSFIGYKKNPKILEIGSNTGFSSIEFATLMPHAQIIGIDINHQSISHAIKKSKKYGIKNIEFIQADGQFLPFKDGEFDLIFCSNTTSFIKDKKAAVGEYFRVLKPQGICAVVPIYYIEEPPIQILKDVEDAIGTTIDIKTSADWKRLFSFSNDKIIYSNYHRYEDISIETIEEYTEYVIKRSNLDDISIENKKIIKEKLHNYYILFNENLKYCGFDILLIMKDYPNCEQELYLTK